MRTSTYIVCTYKLLKSLKKILFEYKITSI